MTDLVSRLRAFSDHLTEAAEFYGDEMRTLDESASALEAQAARIAELEKALDHDPHGEGLWRLWSSKASEVTQKNVDLRAKVAELEKERDEARRIIADCA